MERIWWTYDSQLPQQRQQLLLLLARNRRIVALIHRRQNVTLTLADIVNLLHILREEVRQPEPPKPALLIDLINASQRLLDGNHIIRRVQVVNIHLLDIKECLTPVRKTLHALRSHRPGHEAAGGFGVDVEARAAASLAEDFFAGAVDMRRVDFADVGFFESVVDFEEDGLVGEAAFALELGAAEDGLDAGGVRHGWFC